MSAWTCRSSDGEADQKIAPPRLRIPMMEGPWCRFREKHEPVSDINTAAADSLKVLDPKQPIREADIVQNGGNVRCHSDELHRSKIARYSITSSAATSNVCGTARPRVLAVLRLMTNSNFVGCSTGKSAGLAPRRILST